MAEVIPYEGTEMADDLDTDIGGREGDRRCQYGIRRGVVGGGCLEFSEHTEGDTGVPRHTGEVHLVPERRYRRVDVLPINDTPGVIQRVV